MADKIRVNYQKLAEDDLSNHITDEALEAEDGIINKKGQVRLFESKGLPEYYLGHQFHSEGKNLYELLLAYGTYFPELNSTSILEDNIFSTLYGEIASAISVYDCNLVIRTTKKLKGVNFLNNVSSLGTTIYSFTSNIFMRNIIMSGNKSAKGGCI